MSEFEVQVEREHYFNKEYNHKGRWLSFFYQLRLILDKDPQNLLEIGPGSGWVANILKDFNINTKTLDFDEDLKPDYVAHVNDMPINDNSYDIVCAFEVLEHLPFDTFETNLKEMARVSKKHIIISLPDHRHTLINFSLKVPVLKTFQLFLKVPTFKEHQFDGQHYWEIGKKNYSVGAIKRAIHNTGLIVKENFVPFDAPMNHYFIIEK